VLAAAIGAAVVFGNPGDTPKEAVPAFPASSSLSSQPVTPVSAEETASEPESGETVTTAPLFTAELVIEPQYDALNGGFDEYGLARVKLGDSWHIIDKSGAIISRYSYDSINFFFDERAVVSRGGKYGYIDTNCEELIPPEWDNAFSFSEGYARVVDGGRHGYIDRQGKLVIDTVYLDGRGFSGGCAAVLTEEGYTFVGIDYESGAGPYDDAAIFSEGLAAFRDGEKWGYLDVSFNAAIAPAFDSAEAFTDGLAIVQKDGRQYHIFEDGTRFSPECDRVWNFSDGYATALLDGFYGYIDRATGDFAIEPVYDDVWSFESGLCPVSVGGGEWYYINATEDMQFGGRQFEAAHKYSEGLARVREHGLWGFIDENGLDIVPAEWDDAQNCLGGMIGVCRDEQWGFLEANK
jgi:hypothetical protein